MYNSQKSNSEMCKRIDKFDIWVDMKPTESPDYLSTLSTSNSPEINSDQPPRTSTPIPDLVLFEDPAIIIAKNPYTAWKSHLRESPKRNKIRGTPVNNNHGIISGHFDMREPEIDMMPTLNKCFLNLLINGPPKIDFQRGYHRELNYCNCESELYNVNLPIGKKYDDHGNVIPSMNPLMYQRDPMCIYTS